MRRFVGEVGIRPRQRGGFVMRERSGKGFGAKPGQRPGKSHAQAVAPEQRARTAPGVFREPAGAAAQRLAERRSIKRGDRQNSRKAREQHPARYPQSAPEQPHRAAGGEPENGRAGAGEQHRNQRQHCADLGEPAGKREAEEENEQQPGRKIAHIAECRRRPHDSPDALADVIGGGRQNRVPAQVLANSIQRGYCAGRADRPQNRRDARGPDRQRRRENHHCCLRQRAELTPVGAVERERGVRTARGGYGERDQRERGEHRNGRPPDRHQSHARGDQQDDQFWRNVEVEEPARR